MPKILLAEDDTTMLTLLKTLLAMEGFEVVSISDNENIIQVVRREHPDVALLDVHLAHGNGLDVLKEIRVTPELKNTVVIMSSGMNLEAESLRAGANDFIMKPYMPDMLISTIRKHLPA